MQNQQLDDVIRIANCSGFMGDRFSAAQDMVTGGPIDVLTGDYLAELTMGLLHTIKGDNPNAGYASNFLHQAKTILAECLQKNIKIVVNAGGLNPKALVQALDEFADEQGLSANIACIEGDDLTPRIGQLQNQGEPFCNIDTGMPLAQNQRAITTANAYLGGWGIKTALDQGADVVIAPRVTDAALVLGPAAWKFNWRRDDFDALAGAITAGHIIECGPQATGGNYSFFEEVQSFSNIGFPIAELSSDGSFVITKHPGTGGLVSTGTVTAQLLYEINAPAYLNPDVVAHFDSLKIDDLGDDRVRVSGIRGSNPPSTHKVCINTFGGYKTTISAPIAGLDAEKKAKVFSDAWFEYVGGRESFDEVCEDIVLSGHTNPSSNEQAFSIARITVKSKDKEKLGFAFSAAEFNLVLGNIPGLIPSFTSGFGQSSVAAFMVHWPTLVSAKHITERVVVAGKTTDIEAASVQFNTPTYYQKPVVKKPAIPTGSLHKIALGRLYGTRSGDKGGNANVGVWAKTAQAYSYLHHYLTVEKLKQLLPDTADFDIERYELDNINALNFYIKGYLGQGASASTRIDGLAKSLGEYLGCKIIPVPECLLSDR